MSQKGSERGLKLFAFTDDGRASIDQRRGDGVPTGTLVEHKECVPVDPTCLLPCSHVVKMFTEPRADGEIRIPELDHASIGEDSRIPAATRVARKQWHPNCVDANFGVRVIFQDVIVDPTGPRQTLASSRGKQKDHTRNIAILVEGFLELRDVRQVVQLGSGTRRRRFGCTARQQE